MQMVASSGGCAQSLARGYKRNEQSDRIFLTPTCPADSTCSGGTLAADAADTALPRSVCVTCIAWSHTPPCFDVTCGGTSPSTMVLHQTKRVCHCSAGHLINRESSLPDNEPGVGGIEGFSTGPAGPSVLAVATLRGIRHLSVPLDTTQSLPLARFTIS
jgi:hypothetical protein